MCQKYVKSCKKLKEKSLPPKEKLFSILNNKAISDQNYRHAERESLQFIYNDKNRRLYIFA